MEKFRAVFYPRFGEDMVYHSKEVGSWDRANSILDEVANYTLVLHECSLMPDWSNIGWVEQFVDGEWVEVE